MELCVTIAHLRQFKLIFVALTFAEPNFCIWPRKNDIRKVLLFVAIH